MSKPFQGVIRIIEAVVDALIEQVLEARRKVTAKDRPVGFRFDVGFVIHPPVLQSICQAWVKTMSSSCVTVCGPEILCSCVALCNERNCYSDGLLSRLTFSLGGLRTA